MKNNKITSIWLFAILSLSIIPMLFQNSVYAQAPITKINGFDHDLHTTGFSNDKIWALARNGTSGTTANNWLYEVDPVNATIDNLYNVTRETGAQARDMWCSPSYCYITDRDTSDDTGGISQIATISEGDETIGEIVGTIDDGDRAYLSIDGRYSSSGDFSILFFSTDHSSDSSERRIGTVNGALQLGATVTLFTTGGTGQIIGNTFSMLTENQANRIVYSARTSASLQVYSLNDQTFECQVNPNITSAPKILKVVAPDGTFWTGGDPDLQEIYISGTSDGDLVIVKDSDQCDGNETISSITTDTTGLSDSNQILNGIIMNNKEIAILQEAGAVARVSVLPYDPDPTITNAEDRFGDSIVTFETNPISSQIIGTSPTLNTMIYDSTNDIVFWAETGSGRAVLVFDVSSFDIDDEESEEQLGLDCSLPENTNILICRLTDTTGGNIGGLGGIIDTGLFSLFTNSGLIDGEDTDPKTNGVGYFITIAGFGVMTAMFFIATKGRLNDVPTFVWMLSAIALLGAITAIGWLDPTFLIIGIISIIALAAMQVRNTIDRGLDFGGSGNF